METFWIVLLAFILFLIISVFIVSLYAYHQAFFNKNKKLKDISQLTSGSFSEEEIGIIKGLYDEFKDDPYEKVSIDSYDGLKLNARYYEYNSESPLQIMFHGYKSEGLRDFVGGIKLAKKVCHNVLLVEQRGHGDSKSSTTTLGTIEKYDCLEWVKYACERFGENTKIILSGVSMGAATILMASEYKLPKNVVGIIADSPFSSPADIIKKVLKDKKLSPKFIFPFVKFGALIYGGFVLNEKGAVDAVKNAKIPVLIIHGDADTFVPVYMSKEIYYNCASKKELHIFNGADHVRSFLVDCDKYEKIVSSFLNGIL